jgi:hypothetical protein
MFPISDRDLIVFWWPLETVGNFDVNENKIGYNWKKNFSPAWNMIIWQFLTENYIQGGLTKKSTFDPGNGL